MPRKATTIEEKKLHKLYTEGHGNEIIASSVTSPILRAIIDDYLLNDDQTWVDSLETAVVILSNHNRLMKAELEKVGKTVTYPVKYPLDDTIH